MVNHRLIETMCILLALVLLIAALITLDTGYALASSVLTIIAIVISVYRSIKGDQ